MCTIQIRSEIRSQINHPHHTITSINHHTIRSPSQIRKKGVFHHCHSVINQHCATGNNAPARLSTRAGRVHELNWLNWKEALGPRAPNWTERSGSKPDQAGELNWTYFFKRFWTEFVPLQHTTPQTSKQAHPAKRTIPPPRRQTLGWWAGIMRHIPCENTLSSYETL